MNELFKFKHVLSIESTCELNTNPIICVGNELYVTSTLDDSKLWNNVKRIFRINLETNMCFFVMNLWHLEHFVKNIHDELYVCFGKGPTWISKIDNDKDTDSDSDTNTDTNTDDMTNNCVNIDKKIID